ncbi:MAG: Tm-1-like ATP-binding domain-containing protein, partial [Pseudomonadota bacterium]
GNEWDRPGGPLSDPEGLAAFIKAFRVNCPANVDLVELDAHINDKAFSDAVLAKFDVWTGDGTIK